MNSIGIRLREERNKLGLSQEKLAEVGGVQKLAQTNYETGKRSPTGDYLVKISEIGADVNYILTGVRVTTGKLVATTDDAVGSMTTAYTPPTGEGTKEAANEGLSEEKREWLRMLDLLDDDAKKATFATTKTLAKNCEMAREFAQFRQMISNQAMVA
jgi:transcriptional regulator with XRE-family HTH domain